MLSLNGNSEQAFATLNSINANPVTWMEWNYNEIVKPYVVYSSSANPLSSASNLKYASNWDSSNGGRIYRLSQGGYETEVDNSSLATVFQIGNAYSDSFTSSVSMPTGSGYYKLIFFVKADSINVFGSPDSVTGFTVSAASTGVGSTYYYRVVPKSRNFYQPQFDPTGSDAVSIQTNSPSITLRWYADTTSAFKYDIYRGTSPTFTPFLAEIPASKITKLIDVDSGMQHFESSDNWTVSASLALSASAKPYTASRYPIIPKSLITDVMESDLEVFDRNNKSKRKESYGAVCVRLLKNTINDGDNYKYPYSASITNVDMNMYADNDKNIRFSVDTDLGLISGDTYTFSAVVTNPDTYAASAGTGSVTVYAYTYSASVGGTLLNTASYSIPSSQIQNTWRTLPVSFTASTGTWMRFRVRDTEIYRINSVNPVKKGVSYRDSYPLAIDAVGLWRGSSAQRWTPNNSDNIFYLLEEKGIPRYKYVDDLSRTPQSLAPDGFNSSNFLLSPMIRLLNNNNYLENTKYFCRIIDENSMMPVRVSNSIEVDGSKYVMVEVFFGANTTFDCAEIDLNITSPTEGARMFLCKPEIVKIDEWNFYNWEYFPIESPFYTNRPGEALLHPYLPSSDKIVKNDRGSSIPSPVSNVYYDVEAISNLGYPFKQSLISKYNKFKYYLSPEKTSKTPTIIRAQYNKYLDINKIVVKASNAMVDMTTTSGSIRILGPSNSVLQTVSWSSGAFNSNGIMVLYYDGDSWSTSRGSWAPPKLTDSGILQNVTSSVTGIVFIHNGALSSSDRASSIYSAAKRTGNVRVSPDIRSHIIEISPRLEIDISDLTAGFDVSKTIDNEDSVAGFPIGYINANAGSLEISNVPVYKNTFPHTIFDNISENSTFSDILRQNVKFTVGLISPTLDFTDYVPVMTMYSESWNISGIDKVTVNLFDTAKGKLMATEAPDYLAWTEDPLTTITNLLDVSGISDYDLDSLRTIMNSRSKSGAYFWCEKKDSLFDVLKRLFVSHQVGASFDEYGVLRFIDLDKIIYTYTNSSFKPDFAVTDLPLNIRKTSGLITYESNIIKDSYTPIVGSKIGKIIIQYRVPNQNISANTSGNFSESEKAAYQENTNIGLIGTWAGRSILSNETSLYIPLNSGREKGGAHTVGNQQGYAFLGGELIHWSGLEYIFSPQQNATASATQTIKKVISFPNEISLTVNEMLSANPNLFGVDFEFTGWMRGISRGQKFTSVRNHYMYDDFGTPRGFVKSTNKDLSQYFSRLMVESRSPSATAALPARDKIAFDNNICKMVVYRSNDNNGKKPKVVVPETGQNIGDYRVPTTASNFNYFSAVFSTTNLVNRDYQQDSDYQLLEVGFYIDHEETPLLIGIRNYKNNSYLAINNLSRTTITPYINNRADRDPKASAIITSVPDVFDGKEHRISIKIVDQNLIRIWIDDKEIKSSGYRLNSPAGTRFSMAKAKKWGFYADNLSEKGSTGSTNEKPFQVNVSELYAVDDTGTDAYRLGGVGLDPENQRYHHWNCENFLNLIMKNDPRAEPAYYFWGNLRRNSGYPLIGAYFYEDQEFNTGPAQPMSLVPIFTGYDPGVQKGKKQALSKALPINVNQSKVYANPYRFSMGFVNNSKQLLLLSSSDNKVVNGGITNIQINGVVYSLSDQLTLEKVINPANINNSTTLTTDWVHSADAAQRLLEKAALLADSFATELSLDIFGNPLIQVGDICQFLYSLKKIGYDPENGGVNPKYFIVKAVKQSYSAGLRTTLSMRPLFDMKYTDIE